MNETWLVSAVRYQPTVACSLSPKNRVLIPASLPTPVRLPTVGAPLSGPNSSGGILRREVVGLIIVQGRPREYVTDDAAREGVAGRDLVGAAATHEASDGVVGAAHDIGGEDFQLVLAPAEGRHNAVLQ